MRATRDAHAPRCVAASARAAAPASASASANSYGSVAAAPLVGTLVREARPGASVQLYRITHYEVEGDDELVDLVPFTVTFPAAALGAAGEGGAERGARGDAPTQHALRSMYREDYTSAFAMWRPIHAAAALGWPLDALRELARLCPEGARESVPLCSAAAARAGAAPRQGGARPLRGTPGTGRKKKPKGDFRPAHLLLPTGAQYDAQRTFLRKSAGLSETTESGLWDFIAACALGTFRGDVAQGARQSIAFDVLRSHTPASDVVAAKCAAHDGAQRFNFENLVSLVDVDGRRIDAEAGAAQLGALCIVRLKKGRAVVRPESGVCLDHGRIARICELDVHEQRWV